MLHAMWLGEITIRHRPEKRHFSKHDCLFFHYAFPCFKAEGHPYEDALQNSGIKASRRALPQSPTRTPETKKP
jgi:hypothetical protein